MNNPRKSSFARPVLNAGASPMDALKIASGEANDRRPYELRMDLIRLDQEIQVRVGGLNGEAVRAYTAILENEGELPPITVYRGEHDDGYWLADGFHRYEAHINAGKVNIMAFVRDGDRDDALEFAESANLEHGLALSNEDKKNILHRRLERGHEWAQWSNGALARVLGVSSMTIKRWVDEFATITNVIVDRSATIGADGKTRNTENIGNTPREQGTSAETEAPVETKEEVRKILINGQEVSVRNEPVPLNENGGYQIGGSNQDDLPQGVTFAKIDTGGGVVVPQDDVSAMRFREAAVKIPVRNILEAVGKLLETNDAEILQSLPQEDLDNLAEDVGLMIVHSLRLMAQIVPGLQPDHRGEMIYMINLIDDSLTGVADAIHEHGFFE